VSPAESEIRSLRAEIVTLKQLLGVQEQVSLRQAQKLRDAMRLLEESKGELERRVAERTRELEEATRRAVAASRAKSEFLANMSHEIRTPMNGIIGMTELAIGVTSCPIQRDHLETIQSSADSLLAIINDILDFSKIEAGKITLESVEFSLRDALEETLRSLALRAHEKGLELAASIAPDLPEVLVGDPVRVRQVIVNLVSNAIKFTERGEVIVEVRSLARTDREIDVEVSVRDTGIGIPKDKLGLVFESFTQADSSITRSYGGTGLGLTIASQLVGRMGGEIRVESEPGVGSTFTFSVRLGCSCKEALGVTRAEVADLRDMPTLVVDDHPINRRILFELLKRWGMRPACAASGAEALLALEHAAASGEPFRLVLLDAMMPGMDGFTVASEIQADPELRKLTVMMLSSMNVGENAMRASSLGIASYIQKPVRQADLLDAIQRHVGEARAEAAVEVAAAESVRATRPLKVLLAEDNLVNRRVATGLLTNRGHEVVAAHNGREAVDRLGAEPFDVVLMDVQMPVMDGFVATAIIREREKQGQRRTPIIAMTAHAMAGDRDKCIAAGMDDYVSKPIAIAELSAAIARQTAGTAAPPESARAIEPPVEHIDRAALLASLDGDEELLAAVIDAFVTEAPSLLDTLRKAVREGDGERVFRTAHALKSSVGSLGATGAMGVAKELEVLGRSEANLADAKKREAERLFAQLSASVVAMAEALPSLVARSAA
jgi:two-component system, sensor histidine kinase and response regulator